MTLLDSRKLVAVFGAGLTLLFGVTVLRFRASDIIDANRRGAWPTARATIRRSECLETDLGNGKVSHRLDLEYAYQVGSKAFFGQRVTISDPSEGFWVHARVEDYPRGRVCEVYYDPAQPKTACLEPGLPLRSWIILALGLLLFGAGACGLYGIVLHKNKKKPRGPSRKLAEDLS